MDAALITGKFNFGLSTANTLSKDVIPKGDSDFRDIFSKKIENEKGIRDKKENIKTKENDVNEKKGLEIKENTDDKVKDKEIKDTEKIDKDEEVDKKDVKIDKKDEDEELTDKINGLLENILVQMEDKDVEDISFEDVKNFVEVENISLTNDEMLKLQEVLNERVLQNVVEVGPQSVETEKITSNKYDDLEEKLESLRGKLEGSDSNMKEEDFKVEEADDELDFEELGSDFVSSFEGKSELRSKVVKSKESKNDTLNFEKKWNVEEKFNQLDVKLEKMDVKITDGRLESLTDKLVNKSVDMQEQIDVLKQVSERVDVNLLEDKSEMIIKLKPDHLGKVTVEIAVENGNVTAKFLAESQKVKEILEANIQDLKDHLANQGMVVQDLSVSVGNDGRGPLFNQENYNTLKKRQKIEEVNNEAFYADDEFGIEELKAMYYYPNSTISYSA